MQVNHNLRHLCLLICLVLLVSHTEGISRCLKVNRYPELDGPPVDHLSANNYGKKTMKWTMASSASRVILGAAENEDACPIGVDAVNSSITELPATTCSAIISTHIGDYIAYCAQEPASKILTYELNCNKGFYGSVIGSVPLVTETISSVFHLEPVDDMISADHPRQLLIALSHNAFSSAFGVLTGNNYFSLSPCRQVFEYKHLTKVATLPVYNIGTVIAFSNNNPEVDVAHSQKLAPVYIARAGEISFCGLADVEHTTDVTVWYREDQMMITYIQKIGRSRRCVLRNFEILFDEHNQCRDIVPWKDQPAIGNAVYNGTTGPLGVETFNIDYILCGCEAVKAVQNESLTYLVVGLSNSAPDQDAGLPCPDEEKIGTTCGCPLAQQASFVLPYNKTTRSFNYRDPNDSSAFQPLDNGPNQVTEITPLLLKDCCLAFQVTSDNNDTRLYTVDMKTVGGVDKPRVDHFENIDLPSHVEKTAWGYCSDDTIFLSYTRAGFVTGNSIFKLQCRMDDFESYGFLRSPYSSDYRSGSRFRGKYRKSPKPTGTRHFGNDVTPERHEQLYPRPIQDYEPPEWVPRDRFMRLPPAADRQNVTSNVGSDTYGDDQQRDRVNRLVTGYEAPQIRNVIRDQYNAGFPGPDSYHEVQEQYSGNNRNLPIPQPYGPQSYYGPDPRYYGPPPQNYPAPLPVGLFGNSYNRTGPLGPYPG